MNKKTFLGRAAASPHIAWAILFILAPICFVIYFAFSDGNGFTLSHFSQFSAYASVLQLSLQLAFADEVAHSSVLHSPQQYSPHVSSWYQSLSLFPHRRVLSSAYSARHTQLPQL